MWIGTYPSNPSYLLSTGEPLAEHLKKNPELIGKSVLSRYGTEIPFLPKACFPNRNPDCERKTWLMAQCRSCHFQRLSLSRFTQTRSLLKSCIKKIPINLGIPITSPRLQ
jgi:hypothetical protein